MVLGVSLSSLGPHRPPGSDSFLAGWPLVHRMLAPFEGRLGNLLQSLWGINGYGHELIILTRYQTESLYSQAPEGRYASSM